MQLKVCGMRQQQNINSVAAIQPRWMGFIFYPPSPRYFLQQPEPADLKALSHNIHKVGVFVNQSAGEVLRIMEQYNLQAAQLHGNETAAYCSALHSQGIKIIKAFSVGDDFAFSVTQHYAPFVDMFLFDTKGKNHGGNGTQFNWELLKKERFGKPFLLSGGIGPGDAEAVKGFYHREMIGVDVNSRFETEPGIKNAEALKQFKQQLQ